MSIQWYYRQSKGEGNGPVSEDQLRNLALRGELLPEHEIRLDSEQSWSPASDALGLTFRESPAELKVSKETNVGARFTSMLGQAGAECARVSRVMLAHFSTCASLGRVTLQKPSKSKGIDNAVVRLGASMYECGNGDKKLRARVEDIEERIESLRAAKGSHRSLDTERRGMLIRLAGSPLPNNPPAAVVTAAADLARAKAAAENNDVETRKLRGKVVPVGKGNGYRLAAGYGVIGMALLLLFVIVNRNPEGGTGEASGNPESTPAEQVVQGAGDEERMNAAVGFVVCGGEIIFADGSVSEVPDSVGTAFVVTSDGYLITNKHVVEPAIKMERRIKLLASQYERQEIAVQSHVWIFLGEDQKFQADIKYVSKKYDLAVLKIDASSLPVFRLNGSDNPGRTTEVWACGFPSAATVALSDKEIAEISYRAKTKTPHVEEHFKSRDFMFVSTAGSVGKVAEESGDTMWIQHDAQIHGGNSGGPLMTLEGVVIGINTRVHRTASGLNFSISLPQLRKELDEIVPGLKWD
jgi:S1-C subfamily serine protease